MLGDTIPFLQKPFTPDVILRTVRAALDAVTRPTAASVPSLPPDPVAPHP
jgi:FixJ family two-component response regulator